MGKHLVKLKNEGCECERDREKQKIVWCKTLTFLAHAHPCISLLTIPISSPSPPHKSYLLLLFLGIFALDAHKVFGFSFTCFMISILFLFKYYYILTYCLICIHFGIPSDGSWHVCLKAPIIVLYNIYGSTNSHFSSIHISCILLLKRLRIEIISISLWLQIYGIGNTGAHIWQISKGKKFHSEEIMEISWLIK